MKKILVIAAAFFVSACATVPDVSPVNVITRVDVNSQPDSVRVIARPPVDGMSATEIVEGFIAANASLANSSGVARMFMIPTASSGWNINETWIIDNNQTQIEQIDQDKVRVSFSVLGQLLNSRLHWFEVPEVRVETVSIANTPDGYRISALNVPAISTSKEFFRNYHNYTVYFQNADFTQLIPDTVWLATSTSNAATLVMRTLLAGPEGTFKAALRSAVPAGTTKAISAVPTSNGVMNVSLAADMWQMNAKQKRAMLAQIVWSLTSASSATRVSVLANGQPMTVGSVAELTRKQFAKYIAEDNEQKLYISDLQGLFSSIDSTRAIGVLGPISQLAVSSSFQRIAYIESGKVWIAQLDDLNAPVAIAQDVVDLTFDNRDRLWLVNRDGSLSIVIGSRTPVLVNGLDRQVIAIAAAPDGTHLATIEASPAGNVLRVRAVTSTNAGVSVTAAERIETILSDVSDMDWTGASSLVVIARVGVNSPQIYRVGMDGSAPSALGEVNQASQISAAPQQPIVVVSKQGVLSQYVDGQWQTVRTVNAAAYSG